MQVLGLAKLMINYGNLLHKLGFMCRTFKAPILYCIFKVAVNRKLQNFMHGLSTSVLYIQVYTVRFPIIYCRASLVLTITANFIAILCSYARI